MNTTLDIKWDHFIHSPSRKDGISEHVERFFRSDTCKFIDEFGRKTLSYKGQIRLLANALFHHFYLFVSFNDISRYESAIACLILAAKIKNRESKPKVKEITYAAAHYLYPNAHFHPKQLYHWMRCIHTRERQMIERLNGELSIILPIQCLKFDELQEIIFDSNNNTLKRKNKHLMTIFRSCFDVFRILFRSIICIYYPPPYLAAVAVFKSLKKYNKNRLNTNDNTTAPKLYLKQDWLHTFDRRLHLNTICYISDEIDACDDSVVSVKDYTLIPYELHGIKEWAIAKRVSLIRSTSFEYLPIAIQNDLRNVFKLKENECIDLRCDRIKQLKLCKTEGNTTDIDVFKHWINGSTPTQYQTIKKYENMELQMEREEGEIVDDGNGSEREHVDIGMKWKRKCRNMWKKNGFFDKSLKHFKTKTRKRIQRDLYHRGMEKYDFVKKCGDNVKDIDEDNDMFFMNWCTQSFVFDDNGCCVRKKPDISINKELSGNDIECVYRLHTPDYNDEGVSVTSTSGDGVFMTKSNVNYLISQPPHKKIKTSHGII